MALSGVKIALVASSDLVRAQDTARLLAREAGYRGALHLDEGLREHDVGDWNGLTTDQIAQRWPGQLKERSEGSLKAFPGGEELAAFRQRVQSAAARLGQQTSQLDGELVVVTHGGALNVLESWLGVWSPERRHLNLSGWWLELAPSPDGGRPPARLRALYPVQLVPPTASHSQAPQAGQPAGEPEGDAAPTGLSNLRSQAVTEVA